MKIIYNFDCRCCFDCHCCVDNIEINVPENSTEEQIEQEIFNDIVEKYANNFNWEEMKYWCLLKGK